MEISYGRCLISTDLRFHISGIDEPDKAWEKLESMFSKQNEIWGHQLENELLSLNPNDFSCIQVGIKILEYYV